MDNEAEATLCYPLNPNVKCLKPTNEPKENPMEKKIIQISIAELNIDKRGPIDGAEDTNIFKFSLSYPAEDIPNIETVKTIKANKQIPSDWSSDFDKSIVFKTPLRGKAKLTIEAASVDKDSDGEKFFKGLFKSLFGAVLGVWTGGFGSAYTGAITKTVGGSLVDLVDEDDDIDIIGSASTLIDSERLPNEITLDLSVKTPVVEKEHVSIGGGPRSRRRRRVIERVIIPAGVNGRVKLKIQSI